MIFSCIGLETYNLLVRWLWIIIWKEYRSRYVLFKALPSYLFLESDERLRMCDFQTVIQTRDPQICVANIESKSV
jgi:hypothetical protein